MIGRDVLQAVLVAGGACTCAMGQAWTIESIAMPEGLVAETGGVDVHPDGTIYACFHYGEVYRRDPVRGDWTLVAEGLHDPLGIVVLDHDELLVMQRPELTRLRDTDGDGRMDHYETVTDDFGLSGNYHEFNFGPLLAADGSVFIGLNVASNGSGVRHEMRGTYRASGRDGRMFSVVPWRGWIMRVLPGGETVAHASGFRSPNGLGLDLEGRLFVSDNQGDWIGTSCLYHVEEGNFYGHVASLVWKPGFEGRPLDVHPSELDRMRQRPCVQFPHGVMANSPTQPLCDTTGGRFGPFAGQLFVGEMNRARIMRVMLEEVDGQIQGACIPFFDAHGLRLGNNRLAFAPDGSLVVGQTDHGWAGAEGMQRITWTGEMPMDVLRVELTGSGFDLEFTRPVDGTLASDPSIYDIRRFFYNYHAAYGSDAFDIEPVPVRSVKVSDDGLRVSLAVDSLRAWRVYEFRINGLAGSDGTPLAHPYLAYTLNHLLHDTPPAPRPLTRQEESDMKSARQEEVARPRSSDVPVLGTRFEAEDAGRIDGPIVARSHAGWTGDGYVDFQGAEGDLLEWTVSLTSTGSHRLMIRYALQGEPRPLALLLDGEVIDPQLGFASTEGWTLWQYQEYPVDLLPGEHQLQFRAVGRSGPNIDHVQIVPLR